jgi:hypothetical protein
MDKPQIQAAPGLAWRPRKNGWAAVWLCRQDHASNGFKPSTHQIGVFTNDLTEADLILIRSTCARLQDEMYAFGNKQPKVFAGTVRDLINAYQTDPDSRYLGMSYDGRRHTDALLKRIDKLIGTTKLSAMCARDIKRLYENIRYPDGKEGRDIKTTAHAAMTAIRMAFSFGVIYEIDPNCIRLKTILSEMKFAKGGARSEAMTFRQCEDVIAAAHAAGLPSIALAQALQFDLRARQRDVIGQWVPVSEPGISVIDPYHARKWLRGLRWEEISNAMFLSHPASKTGKPIERDLTLYPMIMAELAKIPAERRSGPIVVCELTGRPWKQNNFRNHWRTIATAAGIPKGVWNMDSRAGGITETIEATGGNLEAARKEADHSDQAQTAKYSRRKQKSNADTAVIVANFRTKNRSA